MCWVDFTSPGLPFGLLSLLLKLFLLCRHFLSPDPKYLNTKQIISDQKVITTNVMIILRPYQDIINLNSLRLEFGYNEDVISNIVLFLLQRLFQFLMLLAGAMGLIYIVRAFSSGFLVLTDCLEGEVVVICTFMLLIYAGCVLCARGRLAHTF